jgi:hypothetical protein
MFRHMTRERIGMSPRWVRRIVLVVFAGGIAGMIVSSIADSTGGALTFGLLTAGAALGLILVASVAPPSALGGGRGDEDAAAALDEQVTRLIEAGADEHDVRHLVRTAVRLGRSLR